MGVGWGDGGEGMGLNGGSVLLLHPTQPMVRPVHPEPRARDSLSIPHSLLFIREKERRGDRIK